MVAGILIGILVNTFLMNEAFPTVTGVETPMSAFEKQKMAALAVEEKVGEVLAKRGITASSFICPSGEWAQCASEHDRKIAEKQELAEAVRKVIYGAKGIDGAKDIDGVEGIDPYQERAAKKYLELLESEADVLIRQAEWAAYKGETLSVDETGEIDTSNDPVEQMKKVG